MMIDDQMFLIYHQLLLFFYFDFVIDKYCLIKVTKLLAIPFLYSNQSIETMNAQREKRVSRPRKIYSPSDTPDQPTHFLLHFDSTDSYNIGLSSSINNITGKTATLSIRGKKVTATIITSGDMPRFHFDFSIDR